jgi:translation initiation factor 5
MANSINIKRDVQDPFYRYKMPRIMAKVEGKGNGIKTVISNMSEVAKALSRPPAYPTKYFGCELGAQTNFDAKNDRYIVNGEHDANKLQDILDGFIKKFVLCPECENPETVLTIRRQTIHSKCKACGHAFIIDSKHKVTTYIVKNPPPVEASEDSKDKPGSPTQDIEIAPDEPKNEKAPSADDDDDDDWAPDLVSQTNGLEDNIRKLVIDPDLEKSVEERLDMLHNYFIKAKDAGTMGDGKQLLNEAERLELKTKAPLLLAKVLITDDIINDLKTHQLLFLRFCRDDKKAQRYLLGAVEQFLEKHPNLIARAPHILKALYDLDLCSEEAILSWSEKPSSRYVKKDLAKQIIKLCEPIITWLKEAEEETESEDEDDDDVAVTFDERSRVIGTVVEKPAPQQANGKSAPRATNGKDEDLDIDDI